MPRGVEGASPAPPRSLPDLSPFACLEAMRGLLLQGDRAQAEGHGNTARWLLGSTSVYQAIVERAGGAEAVELARPNDLRWQAALARVHGRGPWAVYNEREAQAFIDSLATRGDLVLGE